MFYEDAQLFCEDAPLFCENVPLFYENARLFHKNAPNFTQKDRPSMNRNIQNLVPIHDRARSLALRGRYLPGSLLALGLAGSMAWVPALYAQETVEAEEVVVISNRIPVPMRQISTSVSVITEHEIEAHGNLSLTDVLRQQTSIGTSNSGGPGKGTALRIRGEEGFRTLTIFDGLRLQDPSGPQVGLRMEHLMSSGVSRVEVLRGPQGLSYGADAGGVVNLTSTRYDQSEGWQGRFDAQHGRYGTEQYTGFISGGSDRVSVFLSASDYSTDGFNSRVSDNVLRDRDGYDNTTLHGVLGWQATDAWYLQLVHRDVDSGSAYDGCFSSITFSTVHDCVVDSRQEATRLSAEYSVGNLGHEFSYSQVRNSHEDFSEGLPAFDSSGKVERLEYVGNHSGFDSFNLVFGADHEELTYGDYSRGNLGVFAEYLSDFSETWFFTAALRHDDNDDFGKHTTYRVSAAYLYAVPNSNHGLKLRSSLGTGFRAPSPYEMAYNKRPGVYPPASLVDLRQEESRGYEFGVEYTIGTVATLEAVHFNQRVENAITYDAVSWSGYLQDFGSSQSRGLELSARVSVTPQWDLTGNYTYNQARQVDGTPRVRRPKHLVNAGVSYYSQNDRLTVNGFYRYSRSSIDQVNGSVTRLDNFGVLDLSASYRVSDLLEVYGRLENALDENYQEIYDYYTPGRAAYVGVRLNFRSL